MDGVIGRFQIQFQIRHVLLADDLGQAGLGVPLAHILQLGDDDPLDAGGLGDQIRQVVNLLLELVHLLGAFQDVLFVDVPQADVGHVLRLDLVNAEADHQVGDDFRVQFRLSDDLDGLVNIQQNLPQTQQQVELVLLLLFVIGGTPPDRLHPPLAPLVQNLPHPHDLGHAADEDVEVAGHAVLEGGQLGQLGHDFLWVCPAFQVDGQFQTGQVGFISHIGDLFQLARLDQFRDLVHDGFHGGGIGNLKDFDQVFFLYIAPLAPHLQAPPPGLVHRLQRLPVVEQLTAGGEIGPF